MALVSGAVSLSVSGAGHNPAMKLRRLRDGDVLENGDVVLVCSGHFVPDILSGDAVRYYSVYGTYGISVFAFRDATVDELAQQVPLVRFGSLALLKVGDVLAAGMRLEPAGRNSRHYTVGAPMTWRTAYGGWPATPPGRAERVPRRVTWMVGEPDGLAYRPGSRPQRRRR
jgi:hypothetical protein